jgi:hypothetical protein
MRFHFERVVGNPGGIQFDGLSPFRPCGRDPEEFQEHGMGFMRQRDLQHSRLLRKQEPRSARFGEVVCTGYDLNRDAEASQAPEVMMCAALAPALLRYSFSTSKGHALRQHVVEND